MATTVTVSQVVLGVTTNTPAFQQAFVASLLSVLPTGSKIKITAVKLYYDDGSTTVVTRRRLLRSVIGVAITYEVTTMQADASPTSLLALLAAPASVSAIATYLKSSYPEVSLQPPLQADTSPTYLPTAAPAEVTTTVNVALVASLTVVLSVVVLMTGWLIRRRSMLKKKQQLFVMATDDEGGCLADGGDDDDQVAAIPKITRKKEDADGVPADAD